jgi:hypothetical protein
LSGPDLDLDLREVHATDDPGGGMDAEHPERTRFKPGAENHPLAGSPREEA